MGGSFRIVQLFGFDIRAHFSWVFIFLLVAWSLADSYLPRNYGTWSTSTYWVVGIVGSALLFVSVLIHELSHSVVARSRGHTVRAITLFFLGGVSEIEEESHSAGEEFWIAVVGPLTSLVLAAIFGFIFLPLSGGVSQIKAIAEYLAFVNLVLGIFNLLPAYPMDGGRVLKSLVWRATGSQTRATSVAGVTGMMLGFTMIGLGIVLAFTVSLMSGLWLVFIGWFLQSSASASRQQQVTSTVLAGKTVRDAMDPRLPVVGPGITVQELLEEHIRREYQRAYVVSLGDSFQGLVSLSDVRQVDPAERGSKFVAEIMTRADNVVTTTQQEPLELALQKLAANDLNQLVVVQDGNPVGLLSRRDLLRILEVAESFPRA
ncbi:MAG: site-2 protease family protein [Dehalococcoidia bacterium]